MKVLFTLVATLAAVALAEPQPYSAPPQNGGGGGGGGNGGGNEPAQYNFQYDVNDAESGNNFGHQEARDGPRADGTYYVQLPDSRVMTVEYYADETGYHPTITFEGEAQDSSDQYQQSSSQNRPSSQYQQPPSSDQYGK